MLCRHMEVLDSCYAYELTHRNNFFITEVGTQIYRSNNKRLLFRVQNFLSMEPVSPIKIVMKIVSIMAQIEAVHGHGKGNQLTFLQSFEKDI